MRYLENFNKYNTPLGKLPLEDQVQNWVQYLDDNYPISIFQNMKTIEVSGKNQYLSGPILVKSRLVDKLFYDIKYDADEKGSVIHEPSLRKAIKIWIDTHSKLNKSLESFDVDFAIAKIKEQFPFQKVKEMLDKEVLEWSPEDEDSSYYSENSNDEAEDAIITHLIDWYLSKYPISFFSFDNEYDLSDAIQKEYNFLSHRRRSY
jgi:hypothetical protein